MTNEQRFFSNYFDSIRITDPRILDFMPATIAALRANNTGGRFDEIINEMDTTHTNLQTEVGDVDTGENIRVAKTRTVDNATASFQRTMSDEHDFVARALGGEDSEPYLEFYPQGVGGYSKLTREQAILYSARVQAAATKYTALLGPDLTGKLSDHHDKITTNRNAQIGVMEAIDTDRTERSDARQACNIACHKAVHIVAATFPGDEEKCMSFFNFNLLFPAAAHHKPETLEGTVTAAHSVAIDNKTFHDTTEFTVKNTSENATMQIYGSPL